MDITKTPEYTAGWEWATEFAPTLTELFTSREAATPELRRRLFQEAARRWPSTGDDLINDLKQTAFAAGAMKAVVQTLPLAPETASAVFDAALELGAIWSAEQAKAESLETLKKKPEAWWRKKLGGASPRDVLMALSGAWRRDWARERGRQNPKSKWEILIDTLGSRELGTLAEAVSIQEIVESVSRYAIESEDDSFEIVSRPVYHQGRLIHYPGEIVG